MKPSREKPTPRKIAAIESPVDPSLSTRWRWIFHVCVFVLACLPFLPALSQGFVEWDDDFTFIKNPNWRGLSSQNIDWMFSDASMYMGHYQPLSWLSCALEFELWGLNPGRMHLVNLLIHALNAVLLARLTTRLIAWSRGVNSGEEPVSAWIGGAVAAMFFALHPLRVESVAWATERRDVLSTLFLLSTLLCWLRTKDKNGLGALWWIATLGFYWLSLLSKAWGMTLPALLILLDVFPLRRVEPTLKSWFQSALSTWPFAPFAIWCALKASAAQAMVGADVSWSEHGLLNRLAQASWGSLYYVWKTLLPTSLSPLYELEENFNPWQGDYAIAMVFVAVLSLALFFSRKRFPAGLAAWMAFLILVSPVLGLFQSGAQKAADRYTYLACMPFAALLGAGIALLVEKRALNGWRDRVLVPVGLTLLAVFVALGLAANAQTHIWKDSESLWRQVIAVEPQSYIAHHNLAVTIGEKGRTKEAIELEVRCIELRPGKGNVDARQYLGTLYQRDGRADLALTAWTDAFRVDPEHVNVIHSLEQAFARSGDKTKLYALFDEALAKDPKLVGARMEYALRLFKDGRSTDAEAQLKAALVAEPRHVPSLVALGQLYVSIGRATEAEPLLLLASRIDTRNADALAELGAVRATQGQKDAAMLLWSQALMYAPEHPRAKALMQQYSGQ